MGKKRSLHTYWSVDWTLNAPYPSLIPKTFLILQIFLISIFCYSMFRNVPGCSMFLILTTAVAISYWIETEWSLALAWRQHILLDCLVNDIIAWLGSLEVNPSVLISSLLVGILPYGSFRDVHKLLTGMFCFRKPANSKFPTKTTKRKLANTHSLQRNLPKY